MYTINMDNNFPISPPLPFIILLDKIAFCKLSIKLLWILLFSKKFFSLKYFVLTLKQQDVL